ncbi:MAG: HEAT repeat domain-containing protein [Aggregatilineales bacterium]
MISEDLIDMLIDPDPEVRKRGVMQLGKSKDAEALPYLAEVYRDDEDEEVRELARKAGIFIRKNAPAQSSSGGGSRTAPKARQPEPAATSYSDLYSDSSDGLYADDPEEDVYADADASPLPSELRVSAVDKERAKGLVQQAMDMNMRGDNQRALKALEKALYTDPHLMYDTFTISLASTLTGMDGREAVKSIGPNADQLNKRRAGGSAKRSGIQIIFAYTMLMAGVIVLLGFFLFTWIDFTSVPTEGENGEITTLGEQLDDAQSQFEALADAGGTTPEVQALIDAFNGLNFEFNGLDTTLVSIGAQDILAVMGFDTFVDAMFGGLDTSEFDDPSLAYEPAPLDYTLVLIPIMAVIAIIMGILLLMNSKMSYWIFGIIAGILGIIPLAYFYTSAINEITPTDADIASFGQLDIVNAADLIGFGFWITLAGMLAIIFIPFLAMLTMPAKQDF